MLKFLMTIAALFVAPSLWAQFAIKGNVRAANSNERLEGATVQVEGTRLYDVTDTFGRFSIANVPAGDQHLRVKFLGFADVVMPLTVTADAEINIEMTEDVIVTDEVVVTATRANGKTPSTYSTVDKQAIQKQNFGQDLPFLLNWTPSVVTTSDAGAGVGYTGIRIRGSDATRINVTINGIPYNDAESLGTFWVDIPDIAASSQSIQIQRGLGTSTNGAGAFGATINMQTNTRNADPHAEVANAFGSFNTRRHSLSFGTGLLHDHWIVDGRISKINSDGFIDRASSDLQSYFLSAGYYGGKTLVKAIVFGGKERTYQAWYGVPESRLNNDTEAMLTTAANEGWNTAQTDNLLNADSRTFNPYTYPDQVDDYKQDHYQLHFSHRVDESITLNAALHYTDGKGYFEEYRYHNDLADYGLGDMVIGDSLITSTDLVRRRWLDNDFYGATYSLNYAGTKVSMVVGGAWNRYDGDHFGQIIWAQVSAVPNDYRYYFNNGDKRDFNMFAKTNYQFSPRLNGFVDLQYRRVTYVTSGIENKQNAFAVNADYNFVNPKAGVTYALSGSQSVYASYSVGNREPVRDDFVDNPGSSPRPERLYNLEAGYRKTTDRFILAANIYWMDYKNQLVLTGALNDVGASVRTNVPDSYRAGLEVEASVRLTDRLAWNANATLSRNKIKSFTEVLYDYGVNFDEYNIVERTFKDSDISFSPGVVAASGLTYAIARNLEITWLSKYVGRQYLDNTTNNSRKLDPYFVNDLRLNYSLKPAFTREINISFLWNNLLNERYESNGYTWGYLGGGSEYRENYYYPQAGANLMAMLTLKF